MRPAASRLGFLAAIVVTPLFGMAIYRLLYEPLLKYRPDVPMIASVGLLVLMQDAFRIVFGEQGITFRRNTFAFTTFNFAGITVSAVQIAIVVTAGVVFAGLHLFTTRTRIGIGWRATVSKPQIAASFGVDPIKVRYLNFAIGSALAAIAGGLVALLNNLVDPGDRLCRQLQGARDHCAWRAWQRARHARGKPRARTGRSLWHDLHWGLARSRRDRLPRADRPADDPSAGLHRSADSVSAYEISIVVG